MYFFQIVFELFESGRSSARSQYPRITPKRKHCWLEYKVERLASPAFVESRKASGAVLQVRFFSEPLRGAIEFSRGVCRDRARSDVRVFSVADEIFARRNGESRANI